MSSDAKGSSNDKEPDSSDDWSIDEFDAPFNYASERWQQLSTQKRRDAGLKCACCGLKKKPQRLDAHHRLDVTSYPWLGYEGKYLMAVCKDCHAPIHGRRTEQWADAQGELAFPLNPEAAEKIDRRQRIVALLRGTIIALVNQELRECVRIAQRADLDRRAKEEMAASVLKETDLAMAKLTDSALPQQIMDGSDADVNWVELKRNEIDTFEMEDASSPAPMRSAELDQCSDGENDGTAATKASDSSGRRPA